MINKKRTLPSKMVSTCRRFFEHRSSRIVRVTAVCALLASLCMPATVAKADLSITPWRVVFQGHDRSATVTLVNLTSRPNTYRMNWLVLKADKDGKYRLMPDEDKNDPHSFTKMVIFTPRQVTIEPHATQTIRLSLRRPADLPPGEYRAHLSMTRLAKEARGREEDDPNQKSVSIALDVNLSFSIPVIVRSGEDKDLKISLTDPKLAMGGTKEKPALVLNVNIHRDAGKFSTYGSLNVFWENEKGKEVQIGTMNNIALYPEVQDRPLNIKLTENPTSGKIRVAYVGKNESEGVLWAEKTFPIVK